MDEREARRWIVKVTRHLSVSGLAVGSDGNVSVRLGPDGPFLVTASGIHKGFLSEDDIVLVDGSGTQSGQEKGRASSEFPLHRALYRADPEAHAVVHAHPPWTLALFLAGLGLDPHLLVESRVLLRDVALIPYHPPGSEALARAVAAEIHRGPVQVMAHHGAVSRADTLAKALSYMECLEHSAKVTLLAHMIGEPSPLPGEC